MVSRYELGDIVNCDQKNKKLYPNNVSILIERTKITEQIFRSVNWIVNQIEPQRDFRVDPNKCL